MMELIDMNLKKIHTIHVLSIGNSAENCTNAWAIELKV
jgi:hypothetical protein